MNIEVAKLSLSDSEISSVIVGRDTVSVEMTLWDEQSMTLVFENVSGIQAFAPIGEEISDCYEDENSLLLAQCRAREDSAEEVSAMKCFVFRSAAEGVPILSVVAEAVQVPASGAKGPAQN